MLVERARHVGEAEGYARLQQITAIHAQHIGLAHLQSRTDQQPVKAIVVQFASSDRREGGRQLRRERSDVNNLPLLLLEFKILNPH